MNKDFDEWQYFKVYPWVGKQYNSQELFPYRTLILGESNYTKEVNFDNKLVIECIKEHVSTNKDKNFSRFATKIRRVILGKDTKVNSIKFWENVIFYNFIQDLVGEKARDRPDIKMWNDSVSTLALFELVEKIKIERILVLGKENWKNLLDKVEYTKIDEYAVDFKIGNSTIRGGYIHHPSSSMTYKTWQPIANNVLFEKRTK